MSISIHPSAVVEEGVVLGNGCEIQAGAVIRRYSTLGERVIVHPYAVVGGDPQYLKFDRGTPSGVHVGNGTVIREHVTINRAVGAGANTVVGERCFLMANSHVGHDCVVADDVVLANNAMLAGHVQVGSFTFVGGGAGVHQFARIGESVMVAGHASITRDVPHYVMVAERDDVIGFNVVGLRRRGFSRAVITELKAAFHAVYFTVGNIRTNAAALSAGGTYVSAEAQRFLGFFTEGKRSFARARRARLADETDVG